MEKRRINVLNFGRALGHSEMKKIMALIEVIKNDCLYTRETNEKGIARIVRYRIIMEETLR